MSFVLELMGEAACQPDIYVSRIAQRILSLLHNPRIVQLNEHSWNRRLQEREDLLKKLCLKELKSFEYGA